MSQQIITSPAPQDIQWLSSGKGGRQGRLANVYASLSIGMRKNKRRKSTKLNVTLYQPLIKKMKLIEGDRLAVGLAPGGVVLKRDNETGYSLCSVGKRDSRISVTINSPASTSREYLQKSEVVIMEDGAVFLPFSADLKAA